MDDCTKIFAIGMPLGSLLTVATQFFFLELLIFFKDFRLSEQEIKPPKIEQIEIRDRLRTQFELDATLKVSNSRVNYPAENGLTQREIHFALITEITYHHCQHWTPFETSTDEKGLVWDYEMGSDAAEGWSMTCEKAEDTVRKIGVGSKDKIIRVTYFENDKPVPKNVEVQSLDLSTPNKQRILQVLTCEEMSIGTRSLDRCDRADS